MKNAYTELLGNTLEESFEEVSSHKLFSRRSGLKIEDANENYHSLRSQILEDFYKQNKMAKSVSDGYRSYSEEVVKIVSNYNSFRKRATKPTLDEKNDSLIHLTIRSMNQVGGKQFNFLDYTSHGREKMISDSNFNYRTLGILTGGSLAGLSYLTESFGVPEGIINDIVQYGSFVLPCLGSIMAGKFKLNSDMREKIRDLSYNAGQRNLYLRDQDYLIRKENNLVSNIDL